MRANDYLKTSIWRRATRNDPAVIADTLDWVSGAADPVTPLTWSAIGAHLLRFARQKRFIVFVGVVVLTVGHASMVLVPESSSGLRPSEIFVTSICIAWFGFGLYRAMPIPAEVRDHPGHVQHRRTFERGKTRIPAALLGFAIFHQGLVGPNRELLDYATSITVGVCGLALIYYALPDRTAPNRDYRLLRRVAVTSIPIAVADLIWAITVAHEFPAAASSVSVTAIGIVIVSLGTRAAMPVEQHSHNRPAPHTGSRQAA